MLIVLLLGMLVLAVRAGWGWIADRRLNAVTADLQRRGLLAPIATSPLTDRERAALIYLESAASKSRLSPAESDAVNELDPVKWVTSPRAKAAWHDVVAARADALADVRRARELGALRWPAADADWPLDPSCMDAMNRIGTLTTLLLNATSEAHAEGQDGAAVELLRDLLFLARAVDGMPSQFAPLNAAGICSSAAIEIDDICPNLRIDGSEGAARPAEVLALEEDLLGETDVWGQLERAKRLEIATTAGWIARCRDGHRTRVLSAQMPNDGHLVIAWAPGWSNVAAAWGAGPYYGLQGAKALQAHGKALEAYSALNYTLAWQQLPPPKAKFRRDYILGADFVAREFEAEDQPRAWIRQCVLSRALCPLAAAQLAFRAYTRDHEGRLPPTLDALVPQYLVSVPLDLFASAGARIKYVPAATQPFVYSVGDDGVDNLAAGTWAPAVQLPVELRLTLPDLIWYVGPVRALPAPTTQPGGVHRKLRATRYTNATNRTHAAGTMVNVIAHATGSSTAATISFATPHWVETLIITSALCTHGSQTKTDSTGTSHGADWTCQRTNAGALG